MDKYNIIQTEGTVKRETPSKIIITVKTDNDTKTFEILIPQKAKQITIEVGDEVFKLLKCKNL